MPDCPPFTFHVGENTSDVFAALRSELTRAGATVSGDERSGTISVPIPIGGPIRGSYSVQGKSVEISISSRPSAVTCGTIESKIQDYILDAKAAVKSRRSKP